MGGQAALDSKSLHCPSPRAPFTSLPMSTEPCSTPKWLHVAVLWGLHQRSFFLRMEWWGEH